MSQQQACIVVVHIQIPSKAGVGPIEDDGMKEMEKGPHTVDPLSGIY